MATREQNAKLGVNMNPVLEAKKQARKIAKEKNLKLKDALAYLADENLYPDWKSYKNSIDTFWYKKGSPFLNHWFTNHAEAKDFREKNGGYLLTYKGHYFVADSDYIEFLGFDPASDVWKSIDYDVSTSNALEKIHNYLKGGSHE